MVQTVTWLSGLPKEIAIWLVVNVVKLYETFWAGFPLAHAARGSYVMYPCYSWWCWGGRELVALSQELHPQFSAFKASSCCPSGLASRYSLTPPVKFYPRDAMLARYLLSPCVCPSVRPFVTSRCSTKTAKPRITQTTPYDSPSGL